MLTVVVPVTVDLVTLVVAVCVTVLPVTVAVLDAAVSVDVSVAVTVVAVVLEVVVWVCRGPLKVDVKRLMVVIADRCKMHMYTTVCIYIYLYTISIIIYIYISIYPLPVWCLFWRKGHVSASAKWPCAKYGPLFKIRPLCFWAKFTISKFVRILPHP